MDHEFDTFLSIGETLLLFGRFMLVGFVLGVVYNAARLIKLSVGFGKVAEAVIDFLFVTLFGLTVFIFSVAFGTGVLRLYYIVAAFFGFLINMVTLGNIVALLSKALNKLLRYIKSFVVKKILTPICCMFRRISIKIAHLFVENCQKIVKCLEKPKNRLKNKAKIVYNKYNNAKMGAISKKGGENRNAIKARVTKIL